MRWTAAAGLLMMLNCNSTAQTDQTARATDFIRQAGHDLTALADAAAASDAERSRLQAFLDRVVDVDGVARFCLGRFWVTASDAQQRAYLTLFHRVLLRNVISWVGNHQQNPGHVTIGRPVVTGQDIDVPTVVDRGGDPPAHVTWVVTTHQEGLKIIDVVVEGISMRVTVRNDYASFLQHNNGAIETLIRALQRQADAG